MPLGAPDAPQWHLQGDSAEFSDESYKLLAYSRNASDLYLSYEKVSNIDRPGYVDLARLAYPGYVAKSENGDNLKIERSPDGEIIRIILDKPSDTISVKFHGLWHWHLSTAISAISLLIVLIKAGRQTKLRFCKNT